MLKGFVLLIKFMTRIPLPWGVEYDENELGKATKLFPLVGLVIGAFLAAMYFIFSQFTDNRLIIAVLIVLSDIIITGGLHLDGLADTFDGIFSYRSKHRMLEIMRDSRLGTNGVSAIVVYLLLKTSLLTELDWRYIIVMPVVARMNTVINAGLGKYARKVGMAKGIIENTGKKDVIFSVLLTLVVSFFFIGLQSIPVVLLCGIVGVFFVKLMERKIEGVTGDTLGAILELTSVVVLLIGVILK
jgi:adenosylcobinamide-GDP ribazoletransferase